MSIFDLFWIFFIITSLQPMIRKYPAASILKVVERKPVAEIDDQTLILADVAEKAIRQVERSVRDLVEERMPEEKAAALARTLATGTWTHDYPIAVGEAREIGLPVSTDMPREVFELMRLYGEDSAAKQQSGREAGAPAPLEVPPEEELERLRDDLAKANRESEEHFRSLQRAQADLANYHHRVEQERGESIRAARAEVILGVRPVLDDFERALEAVPPEYKGQPWLEGIALIERKLRGALETQGVRPVEALGKQFDPWEHETVLHEESPGHGEGEVTEVIRPGYKLQGKVIRPAMVKVAKDA